MVFGKIFYRREAKKEGADVEPWKNDINTAGSIFGQGEHLVTSYSGLFCEKLNTWSRFVFVMIEVLTTSWFRQDYFSSILERKSTDKAVIDFDIQKAVVTGLRAI